MTLEQATEAGRGYTFGNESVHVFSDGLIKLDSSQEESKAWADLNSLTLYFIKPLGAEYVGEPKDTANTTSQKDNKTK